MDVANAYQKTLQVRTTPHPAWVPAQPNRMKPWKIKRRLSRLKKAVFIRHCFFLCLFNSPPACCGVNDLSLRFVGLFDVKTRVQWFCLFGKCYACSGNIGKLFLLRRAQTVPIFIRRRRIDASLPQPRWSKRPKGLTQWFQNRGNLVKSNSFGDPRRQLREASFQTSPSNASISIRQPMNKKR